ncbi:hypothetical protein [Oryza sativa Japonica Group]|uniref:Uncharacterized protein P0501G01.15 n=1 Tax=Oryza sativa subsp. japonica TaxID=39947 RepID=Q5ZE70_ORYSJ|nr:hypothetical protein [Oryza sativa Japonica Group]
MRSEGSRPLGIWREEGGRRRRFYSVRGARAEAADSRRPQCSWRVNAARDE